MDETKEPADELHTRKQNSSSHRQLKDNARWSHVKISFDSESVKVESEQSGPTTAITTPAVPPTIKIIGKEVSATKQWHEKSIILSHTNTEKNEDCCRHITLLSYMYINSFDAVGTKTVDHVFLDLFTLL